MRLFKCDNCSHPVFFENTHCLNCNYALGYIPDQQRMVAITPTENGLWVSVTSNSDSELYSMCRNYSEHNVCNWLTTSDNPESLCLACRHNRTIPNLSNPQNVLRWSRIEAAKHRLVYSLLHLGLPLKNRKDDPSYGLVFDFLDSSATASNETEQVLTGHDQGVITINIEEADPMVRLKTRLDMNEDYRTVLGHFRHEVGHYYWQILIDGTKNLGNFRELFGDERRDYGEALEQYHGQGALAEWQDSYISAYSSSHPWEDWAETWAHYLHMVDTLETAKGVGLAEIDLPFQWPVPSGEQSATDYPIDDSCKDLLSEWMPLTLALNSINRSMGLDDIYPFVLSHTVISKLAFIHQIINQARD